MTPGGQHRRKHDVDVYIQTFISNYPLETQQIAPEWTWTSSVGGGDLILETAVSDFQMS